MLTPENQLKASKRFKRLEVNLDKSDMFSSKSFDESVQYVHAARDLEGGDQSQVKAGRGEEEFCVEPPLATLVMTVPLDSCVPMIVLINNYVQLSAYTAPPSGFAPISDLLQCSLQWQQVVRRNGRRLLKNCIKSRDGQVLKERATNRRLAQFKDIHFARRLDAATALSTDYESTRTGLTSNTSANRLFTGEPACLLVPEAIEGTYYVAGELIRSDIREDQPGIDLYMDQQFIDVNTFSPVNELYVDLWHVNASGVYYGVVARTNGNSDDASNIDTTVHRGLSSTDSDGFVSVTTKFPGLYAEVQATGAYADNSAPVTPNEVDSIALQSAADDFDPFVRHTESGGQTTSGGGNVSRVRVGKRPAMASVGAVARGRCCPTAYRTDGYRCGYLRCEPHDLSSQPCNASS
ncbi:hypothetical protein PC121_g23409 [Phytophthora cactorum]|nr:hypothetical protein PC120_g25890 [Phytophthora cactorum]KAG3041230.1 hypothetical protein PC121_g23409 [Phytophthora cactorum]